MIKNPKIKAIDNEINAPIDPRIRKIEKEPKIDTQKILKLLVAIFEYLSHCATKDHNNKINNGSPK